MKKRSVFFVLLLTVVFSSALFAETWKITSLNWQPYSGAEMKTEGNSIQKLRELLKTEGIDLIVEFYPWKRSQKLAGTQDYIGYFPAWPEEVADGFTASLPVDWSEIGVLQNSDVEINFKTVDELFSKYDVGLVSTYVYPEIITSAMKKYPEHVNEAPDEISLLKKLSHGRHPVAITDPGVMMYLASQEGISNIKSTDFLIEKKELVIALRNGDDNAPRAELLKKILKPE